jgi:RHS repeat-associated protein
VEVPPLHRDQLGSVRAVTTFKPLTGQPAGNRRVEAAIYKPFGEQTEVLQATHVNQEQKGWIGQRYDADAGLQFLNARYYDPELGFFLQPDWFEVTAAGVGTNRYSYSFNDPVNFSDPGGNCPVCVIAAILYFIGTDPANAPGPDDQMLPSNGEERMVVAAASMVEGRALGGVMAGLTDEEAAEEELSTLERNALVGALAGC